ncbi:hypothetical protein Agub_g13804, partial [Astrephomene gubernaculifera]
FLQQACSSRLRFFSLPHLTALLEACTSSSASPSWQGLGPLLTDQLLRALLGRLGAQQRAAAADRQRRELQQKQQQAAAAAAAQRQPSTSSPTTPPAPPARPALPAREGAGCTGRALLAALRGCMHPGSGRLRAGGPLVSRLLRALRLHARELGPRDVCEALRLLA